MIDIAGLLRCCDVSQLADDLRALSSLFVCSTVETELSTYRLNHVSVGFVSSSPLEEVSRQPIFFPDSPWVVFCQGAIFNLFEIRRMLESQGVALATQDISEVLLQSWECWGLSSLSRFNGDFALVAYNQESGELYLARDRFGVKPLYWSNDAKLGFVFSTSVSAVASHVNACVNESYCAHGLRYKSYELLDGGTPFVGVNMIPAGGWLKVEVQEDGFIIKSGQWYDLNTAVNSKVFEIKEKTDAQLLEECRFLLEDSIQLRMQAKGVLAVTLSGGVDSSSVAALVAKSNSTTRGFTYGSPSAELSEGPTVEKIARDIGMDVHYVWPEYSSAELDELLEKALRYQEAPFPGLGVLAQNEVYNAAKNAGVKILLGGQGGDEIFAGYRKFFVVALREAVQEKNINSVMKLFYSLVLMLVFESNQARIYLSALSRYRKKSNFSFVLLNWKVSESNLWGEAGAGLSGRQIDDIQKWSLPTLLRYEYKNAVGHGVESRLPFLDYRLVELALALPVKMKIAKGFGKWALREITEGIIPDHVRLNRVKRGFDVTQTWINDGVGKSLRERILDNRAHLSGYLKNPSLNESLLSDISLQANPQLLDEALMLAWLIEPVRK